MSRSLVLYFPGNTFFHKLDPRAKIAFLFLMSIVIFAIQNLYLSLLVLATMLVLWALARLPMALIIGYFKALIPVMIFLFVVQAIFYPGETILVKPLIPGFVPLIGGTGRITEEGILFSLLLSLRLMAMVSLLPLVSMTTPVHILALGLVRLGLPYRMAYTTTTALNLVPILQLEAGVIVDAQRLRAMQTFEKGKLLEKLKAYPALVTPLVIGAMRRAQLMAVAMDSRAFGASEKRTYLDDIEMSLVDWIFVFLAVVYSAGVLYATTML